jgi:hypothetical protein
MATAGIDHNARSEFICERERVVLRPAGSRSVSQASQPGGVRMVKVTICSAGRRACFAMGEEIPMARCLHSNPVAEAN